MFILIVGSKRLKVFCFLFGILNGSNY